MPESAETLYAIFAYALAIFGCLLFLLGLPMAVFLTRLDSEGRIAAKGGAMAGAGVWLFFVGLLGVSWYLPDPPEQQFENSLDPGTLSALGILAIVVGLISASYAGYVLALVWRKFVLWAQPRWSARKARKSSEGRNLDQAEGE